MLPCALRGLRSSPIGTLEDLPGASSASWRTTRPSTPVIFTSPSKRPQHGRKSFATSSWLAPRRGHELLPLLRFVRSSPLHRHAPARPLPRAEALIGPTAPPVSVPVPSSWFLTTSTASSARQSQACCILLPVMGFVPFQGAGIPDLRRDLGHSHRSSRRGLTPFEVFPSSTAVPRHRDRSRSPQAVALLPLPRSPRWLPPETTVAG